MSISISLPDGSVRNFDCPINGLELAEGIGRGLAKAALAIVVNGEVLDLLRNIEHDADVKIITRKDNEVLELLRHDAAHIMAQAVQELYPGTQVTIGPPIENGFYYDFSRKEHFNPDDLQKIEARMAEIIKLDVPFTREIWTRDEAIKTFTDMGENYKVELINGLSKDEEISIYRQGNWFDLCRGPHLPSTGHVGKGFKLLKLAGAYWRGDSKNAMLQRIYGTAWRDEKELNSYLFQLDEAEKRDHRRLGKEMDLFHFQEEAVGAAFWHPKGWTLYRVVESYMRRRLETAGYAEVKTPTLYDRILWENSGHWEKFREHMFTVETDDNRTLAVKPMNCPGHVQIFRQGIKSYRELPIRMAEFGSCHRYEPSGALHGLMRVRAFTQDDAHIFCTDDQITSETLLFCDLLRSIYKDFGFSEVNVKFSDRPSVRAGSDTVWDRAETALLDAVKEASLEYTLNPGDGAFYGPKLEFILRDAIGRDWQCGTLQVDFVLPDRLGAEYIAEDGRKRRPVMLHRAILGSFERFIGILIENYAGRLPFWLSPIQVTVCTITDAADKYAFEVYKTLCNSGIRSELDTRNEKINYKVREHSNAKVPALFVVGAQEVEKRSVAVRRLGGKAQETLALDEAVDRLKKEALFPQEVENA
ncbi:MAG: threonine--tRNA ligase [Rhodospirillaceae bacterium]|nr:threonine--tRNA ligase [Rhodospirillaceae bacterium]|tara:strand:- start:8554 stop:10485 length:1932 start_codon:yes stop_codon:yes gene_type:complete